MAPDHYPLYKRLLFNWKTRESRGDSTLLTKESLCLSLQGKLETVMKHRKSGSSRKAQVIPGRQKVHVSSSYITSGCSLTDQSLQDERAALE